MIWYQSFAGFALTFAPLVVDVDWLKYCSPDAPYVRPTLVFNQLAFDAVVAVAALPERFPLNVVALMVPVEGWHVIVLVEYNAPVTVDGVKPSVPLLLAPQIKVRQFV